MFVPWCFIPPKKPKLRQSTKTKHIKIYTNEGLNDRGAMKNVGCFLKLKKFIEKYRSSNFKTIFAFP